jgi:hypothetical protein
MHVYIFFSFFFFMINIEKALFKKSLGTGRLSPFVLTLSTGTDSNHRQQQQQWLIYDRLLVLLLLQRTKKKIGGPQKHVIDSLLLLERGRRA